jgi:hypothetical protein
MNFLRNIVSNEQTILLSDYLKNLSIPKAATNDVKYKVIIGSSRFLVSKFTFLFVNDNPTADDNVISTFIKSNIENRRSVFGEPCTPNDRDCLIPCSDDEIRRTRTRTDLLSCNNLAQSARAGYDFVVNRDQSFSRLVSNMNAEMTSRPSLIRKGYLLKTCEQILGENRAVTNVLARAGLTTASAANSTNLNKLIELFMPGVQADQEQILSLINVHSAARSSNLTTTDAWRHVIAPLCTSEAFEMM